jgi:predicted SAM-dependent methyltransferase
MVIEAVKPEAQHIDLDKPEELFDKNYFDGGKKVGGYAFEGYRDFPVHWVTAQKILDLEPKSVLEIGCARGYIIKKLEDKGIPCKGLEVSKHCYLTRASDNVINWNVCQTPWPFADKEFDVCFSVAVMEHIPEKHLANVLKEIDRVSQRGIHGIDFGENDDGFDQTHCTLHPLKWWMERFGHNQIVVDKEFMEEHEGSIASYVPTGDNKLKLNIGSHIIMFHNGWVNMDVLNLSQFAIREGYKFLQHDSRTKLPFGDETVDLVYSSHFLEHLTYDDAVVFMTECKRVMKKGATMRLMLPDTELLMSKCANHTMSDFDEINVESANANTDMAKFWNLVFNGHLAAYDFNSLRMLCEKVGLHCERKAFRQGHKQILSETLDTLPCLSLFAEVTKH